MNINKAFRKGEINSRAYELIMQKGLRVEEDKSLSRFCINNKDMILILSLFFVSMHVNNFLLYLLVKILALYLCLATIYSFVQSWRFGKCYKAFCHHLYTSGLVSNRSLEDVVQDRLFTLAQRFEELEKLYGKMSQEATLSRNNLGAAHTFFLSLGLCQEDPNEYFEKRPPDSSQMEIA